MSRHVIAITIVAALGGATGCRPAKPDVSDVYRHPPARRHVAPELIAPPPRLSIDDVLAPIDDADPALRALLPREPAAVNPGRPRAGGEPLRLADLAMTRGDALDAAAQYRALLGDRRPEVATYVRWRLALAYRELGRDGDAEPLLREVAGTASPIEWAALCALADLIEAHDGPAAAMESLRGLADTRAADLEARMIQRGHGPGRVALIVARVRRDPAARDACGLALAALSLDHRVISDGTVRRCHNALLRGRLEASAPAVANAAGHLRRHAQLVLLDDADRAWRDLDAAPFRRLHPADWVAVARRYLTAHEADTASPAGEVAAGCAVAALHNARRVNNAYPDPDPALSDTARLITDELGGAGTIAPCDTSRDERLNGALSAGAGAD